MEFFIGLIIAIVFAVVVIGFGIWVKARFDEILVEKKQEGGNLKRCLNITFGIDIATCIISVIFSLFGSFEDSTLIFIYKITLIAWLAYTVCQVMVVVCEDISSVECEEQSQKSKKVDTLLCMLLGFTGAHRFYEGKIGTGILWLFTLGLFGVGYLIDFIKVIAGKSTDKAGLPIHRWN